jgi:hypothetical protein
MLLAAAERVVVAASLFAAIDQVLETYCGRIGWFPICPVKYM